jgi:hypothetical protein
MAKRASIPDGTRRKVLNVLRAGDIALPEMAKLLGVSTQVLWNWCRIERVDWRKARDRAVLAEWKRARR